MKAKIAVAVSGSGRSLSNFIARQNEFALSYEVAAVIASRADCRAVAIAREQAIPLFIGDFSPNKRNATAASLEAWLLEHQIAWVALAGFLKHYPVSKAWENRVVNIHPALLPDFGGQGMYGDHVHAAVLAAKKSISGATVHFVNDRYDEGKILEQISVPVHADDNVHALADRVFTAECKLYPEALSRLIKTSTFRGYFDDFLATHAANTYGSADGADPVVRYVLSNGGKRVRPLLVMLAAEALGGDPRAALPAAAAVEMVHTYSLVHDDLPCMDDDDLRRGQPTAHKKFGEAMALLAGDAILTDAFGLLAADPQMPAPSRLAMIQELTKAAGGSGMVHGQALDLYWTARHGASRADLDAIHLKKTGFLLGAAAALGAASAGRIDLMPRFQAFGRKLGLAFQIRDDLIDNLETTGKTRGKDQVAGKLTYLSLMSAGEAEAAANDYTASAIEELQLDGCRPDDLIAFARALLYRIV